MKNSKNKPDLTARVEAVIEKIETVLQKSRKSLLDDEIQLLEECLTELKGLDPPSSAKTCLTIDDCLSYVKVVIKLLNLFDIDLP